ncbi:hypothetical protein BGZ95_003270 [Linnemannia exigua]|uniref:BTB domain-containing protein n=1 Tax=Linnemannia exigua TaxID=604196 RepID=A0AAD4D4S1_9FUNG|nr:hypothetical protein BGZ95_003270 [Linnemannia exigua]
MGPALLAGSDSVFEEKDFLSLKNLASSEKKSDESKIGQMGIGFNSIYHLTDCPSFISGDQFMVIEPHERIFNGVRSEFDEGAVRGNFVEGNQGLQDFPDQLKAFSVLEDIDFSKPYNGTIFRFSLRTPEQAEASSLTKYPRSAQEVLDMLNELKDEALKAILFLKHVQKIIIYERKEDQDKPTKLFEIEILNAAEVGAKRSQLLDFKHHVQSTGSLDQDAVLQCSVRPTFRMTQGDGRTTEETWQVTTRIGNIDKTRAAMLKDSNGDVNIAEHKLIPWVGIAAPTDPGIKLDVTGLFCFLPIGHIQLPFPVHVNGHFAVEQSRRDIWTNTDKKIKVKSSAGIESLWNAHLFDMQIPEAYALFLENIGADNGTAYDLWPLDCGEGIGRAAVWKDMLNKTLSAALSHDRPVFICEPKSSGNITIEPYSKVYIAGRDIDAYPLLKKALQAVVNLAESIPDVVLAELPSVAESLGLAPHTKKQWSLTADAATRVEMVKYCLLDDNSVSLVGLPLLPLAEGSWVEFSRKQARERFRVSQEVFRVLSVSKNGLVDLDVEGYPFDEIESGCRVPSNSSKKSKMYWSTMSSSSVAERIKTVFQSEVYQDDAAPLGRVSREPSQFPTDKWLTDFWNMTHSLPSERDRKDLLSGLASVHLIPLRRGYLAPLCEKRSVLYLNRGTTKDYKVAQKALEIMDLRLDCQVLREISLNSMLPLQGYLIDTSVGPRVLSVLFNVNRSLYQQFSPEECHHIQRYLTTSLSPRAALDLQERQVLRCLPVFETYHDARLVPIDTSCESNSNEWRVAQGYHHSSQPWVPTSVNLLAEDQPLKHHLRYLLEIPFLNKAEYLHLLVSQLEERPKSEWDPILSELFLGYYEFKKKVDFSPLLCDLAFVQVKTRSSSEDLTTPARIKPGLVVDAGLSLFFMDGEAVFPAEIYAQPAFRGPLEELGMTHIFSTCFVEERMSTLFGEASHERDSSHKRAAHAFYDRLNSLFSKEFASRDILSKMSSLSWLYVDSGELCRPRACRPKEDRCLVGDQMPISDFSPLNKLLREHMGWTSAPPLDKVLEHLLSLIEQEHTTNNHPSKLEYHDVMPIYRYLAAKVQDRSSLTSIKKRLHDIPWILVSKRMYTTDRVAFKMDHNLSPHFVQVPSSGLDGLYRSLGVRDNIHYSDIESTLMNIASNHQDGECLADEDAALVRRLLFALSKEKTRAWSPELPVLTRNGFLKRAADVVYDDRSARHVGSGDHLLSYSFLDDGIPKDVAQRLQIIMFSVRTWQESKDTAFEPFFQQEDIVTRIKGILNDYDPPGIFNEYLQNASDAGATKFAVILDTRSYEKTRVLGKGMEAWQGPALVLYNDAKFTEEGFSALCKLGDGDKKEDTSKIGRHGLGFNSAYHFTDVPSVVSGHSLVFFDPHMASLPKSRDAYGNLVAQKGHRYDMRKLSTETLVDQLQPYKGFFGCDMESYFEGTIFRLPLRLKGVHPVGKTSFGNDGWTINQVRDMIISWIEDAKAGMLFLKNITTIELSSGDSPMVSVTKHDQSNTPAMQFMTESVPFESCQVSVVDITSTTTGIGSTSSQRWLVYVEDSLPTDAPQKVLNHVQKHYWSTQSGVAIPLGDDRSFKACRGRLMVHLPTPITTKLPFHLHGGFALTTNRKILAGGTDAGNHMTYWNKYLLETRLPLTVIHAYKQLLRWSFRPAAVGGPLTHDLSGAIYLYFKHWPIAKPLESFAGFLRVLFQHTYTSEVFPCRGYPSELPIAAVAGRDVTVRGYLVTSNVESRVFAWLREGRRFIAEIPFDIQGFLLQEWSRDGNRPYKEIDCSLLRNRLREDPGFIARQMKSKADKQWILEELLKPMVSGSRLDEPEEGLCVIPLMNGEWKPLHEFPVYYVAGPEARELINGKNQLVDMDIFDTTLLKTIKDILVEDPYFGIEDLPLGVFSSIFCSENPDGISEGMRERLWKYLEKFDDLTLAQELPILKTTSGAVVKLARASEGLDISRMILKDRPLRILTELFRRLGVVVFDAAENRDHKYLQNLQVGYSERRVLELISRRFLTSASPFLISTDEAEFLRNTICTSQSSSVLRSLGDLPIWPTYGPPGAPLRPAKDALYMTDHEGLDHLGYYSNILKEVSGMFSFDKLGATPVQVATVLRAHIMPKFTSNELQYTAQTKGAYLNLLRSMMLTASRKIAREYTVTRQVLTHGACFRARDGSFQALSHMFVPLQDLTEAVFVNERHRFPDEAVYNILMGRAYKPEIRGVKSSGVVEECASYVLEEIADGAANPEQVLSRAKHLVRYIYNTPGTTNWMDPKWKFVPRELNPDYPYNQHTSALPRYMSFAALCYPDDRDLLWTQRGFFPQDLIPSVGFKKKFPDIGKNTWLERCQHLEVLVRHLAPLTSTERQLMFKAILFKIYNVFEDRGSENTTVRDSVRTSLRGIMTVPYILNGDDKDPSKTESWVWPHDLVFGIDHKIGAHQQAHLSLLKYRKFLVTVGANEMKHVAGQVKLSARRQAGEMEQRITTYFETQDDVNGFMDVRFMFEDGKSILAHKVVLASMSEEVIRQLTGSWALTARRDPANPAIDIIQKGDDYSAFWGLLYFLYTDDLIATNGPPTIPQTARTTVRSTASVQIQDAEDLLSERVQYLMALQHLADFYRADRLKGLIAQELMMPGKVMYSNVFEIREHAELNRDVNVVKYCNQFIQVKENASLIKKYIEDEIVSAEKKLTVLETYLGGGGGGGEVGCEGDKVEAKEGLKEELDDLKAHLEELNRKL